MKHLRVVAIGAVAVAILATFLIVRRDNHKLQLTTYFDNGQSLRAGAPVRLAGVDIGLVRSVRVRPELKDHPVEVIMNINTPYELKIPQDATVFLETAGVLGETFASIRIKNASGAPVANHGVLKSEPSHSMPSALEQLARSLAQGRCGDPKDDGNSPPKTQPPATKHD